MVYRNMTNREIGELMLRNMDLGSVAVIVREHLLNMSESPERTRQLGLLEEMLQEMARLHEPIHLPPLPTQSVGLKVKNVTGTCPICLDTINRNDTIFKTRCDQLVPHVFHQNCLKRWATISPTCPTCRRNLFTGNSQQTFGLRKKSRKSLKKSRKSKKK